MSSPPPNMKKEARIILISMPTIGSLVPTVEFAHHLTAHDHRLSATILVISCPQRPLVTSYVNSRATTTAGRVRFVHLPSVDPPSPDQYQFPIGFCCHLIDKNKPHVKKEIIKLISSSTHGGSDSDSVKVAGLFVDMFCTSMIDVANELGIPCYLYFQSPATFLSFMIHLPTLHDRVAGEFQDSGTEFHIPGFANPVPPQVFPQSVLKRTQDGYSWYLHHARRYTETKGMVVNTFRELEPFTLNSFSEIKNTPPVYPVGPVLDHRGSTRWHTANANGGEAIMKWLDDQPPSSVVFLCFGSAGSLSEAQLREIADGLERTGKRFLWSIRQPPKSKEELPSDYTDLEQVLPDGFLQRTGGIGLVCGWVPQVAVLAHKAIGGFVSHCGWNSIMESLWYGVPIATWPLYAEQQMNAFEMVRELKLAAEIRLDYKEGSNLVLAEELERGVRRLMDDGDATQLLRIKVKEMSEFGKKALMENGSSYTSLTSLIDQLMMADTT